MAQAPDVRVRLSAEGVDEVVRALSRVKAAADSAGKSGKGFALMNDALGDMKGLLPTLGVAAAVGGIVALTKNALESADQYTSDSGVRLFASLRDGIRCDTTTSADRPSVRRSSLTSRS